MTFNLIHRTGRLAIAVAAATVIAMITLVPSTTKAQYGGTDSITSLDPSVLKINEDKFLGASLDKEVILTDHNGKDFKLGVMLDKPLVLLLSYFDCDGACPAINRELRDTLMEIDFVKAGTDYNVLTLSFDKNDTIMKMQHFLHEVEIPEGMEDNWRAAIFKNPEDIEEFTNNVGYRFFWSKRDKVFLHPGVYIIASPQMGWITRFIYSSLIDAKDLELALVESTYGKKTRNAKQDVIDLVLMACYSYNYESGKYSLNYPVFISAAALLFSASIIIGSILLYKNKDEEV